MVAEGRRGRAARSARPGSRPPWPVLLPFSRPEVTRQVAAVHAAQQAVGLPPGTAGDRGQPAAVGRRSSDGGPRRPRPAGPGGGSTLPTSSSSTPTAAARPRDDRFPAGRAGGRPRRPRRRDRPRGGAVGAGGAAALLPAPRRSSTSTRGCSTSRCAAYGRALAAVRAALPVLLLPRAEPARGVVRLEPALLLPDLRRGRGCAHRQRAPRRRARPDLPAAGRSPRRTAPGPAARPSDPAAAGAWRDRRRERGGGRRSSGLVGSGRQKRTGTAARAWPAGCPGSTSGSGATAAPAARALPAQRDRSRAATSTSRRSRSPRPTPGSTPRAGTGCRASCSRSR